MQDWRSKAIMAVLAGMALAHPGTAVGASPSGGTPLLAEETLFDFAAGAAALSVAGDVRFGAEDDTAFPGGQVLRVSYPAHTEGAAE